MSIGSIGIIGSISISSGIVKVTNDAARLALSPADGDMVVQLDSDAVYVYDSTLSAWVIIGGSTVTNDSRVIMSYFTYATPNPISLTTMPINTMVEEVKIVVDSTFNGTGATIKIGKVGATEKYMASVDNDLYGSSGEGYVADYSNDVISGSSENIIATIDKGTATSGNGRIIIYYSKPTIV
jgi:hypothetical protein